MSVDQVSLLLSLLAFVGLAIGVVTFGVLISGQSDKFRPLVQLLVPLALAIALASTIGSLYYSNIADFRPCRLCWWQRIFMYPLVPILGLGVLRRDRSAAIYALPLALGGLGYAAYHTQLRWFPDQGSSCEAEAACTSVWVNAFGFVSIPFMAFSGFFAIAALAAVHLRLQRPANDSTDEQPSPNEASERRPA